MRSLVVAAVVLLGGTTAAGTAWAEPAQHTTDVFTDTVTGDSPVVCGNGPIYTLTQSVVITDDEVLLADGSFHDRVTVQLSFTGTPLDPALPDVTGTSEGHSTFNFSVIGAAQEALPIHTTATYSDGTKVTAAETFHFTIRHDRTSVVNFDRCASSAQ